VARIPLLERLQAFGRTGHWDVRKVQKAKCGPANWRNVRVDERAMGKRSITKESGTSKSKIVRDQGDTQGSCDPADN